MAQRILFQHVDIPDIHKPDVYVAAGGYTALKKALREMPPEQIVQEVKDSGLRGRGGAGFPTGVKWGFIPKGHPGPIYLVCNADESEPGTFKDRELMERNPHQLIEGMIITCYAIRSHLGFMYIRGEFAYAAAVLEKAIGEARAMGIVGRNILGTGFDCDIIVHRGAGAYICGEETALLNSLEGKRGNPRAKPPFPASQGLYAKPTIINNVETLSNVPHIVNRGAQWYRGFGTENSPGTKVFCVSGNVTKPGNYELEMGVPLREVIYDHGGGVPGDKKIKAVIPGGSSVPYLTGDQLDTKMSFEGVAEAGSMLGCAAVIVIDEDQCIVRCTLRMSEFYEDESCGWCTPCREGTLWFCRILERIEEGYGKDEDLDLLLDLCDNIAFKTHCPLGDAAVPCVESAVKLFRDEFLYHIRHGRCMVGPGAQIGAGAR
jgi:NADH-quinone oxidoreductase subunit F